MCWSGEASMALAVTGITGAAYSALKRNPEPRSLWLALLYFASMELLQAISYTVLNQCDAPLNQIMTLLGYLHIAFQAFFINAVALYFIPKATAKIVAPWVYFACFLGSITMLFQLYPFSWAGHCAIGLRPMCSELLCTVRGEWHIAWLLPTNGIGNSLAETGPFAFFLGYGYLSYPLTSFVLPTLIGSWRLTLFTFLAGPILARATTSNLNEFPAIWCLFSIALCLTILKTPLRTHLHVGEPWWYILQQRWFRESSNRPAR